ncbi:uncharacterized protein LOC126629862 isoform X2 [Malus sylvestris]|uniref:uncharacterized protein LOC126629862 isoform X2 n=1 Tax=Malus sylvestris TaxID=3752 RepID=UPI0021ABCB03|nr:uncharacterized protein LOC126629862 isoform X2 [Malus sylvestris]XP_050155963.1 uncharacterized protein LOC126629862 isoform X2 [Malus sylvestris]
MGPELEPKPKSGTGMELPVAKDGSINRDLEDKLMPCIVESECGDLTESSSSFGDTTSGTENGYVSDGDEVQSPLHGNEFAPFYDEYFGAFETRRKRLTTHWNKFIRPLMWRLKWLELKIKELQSQDKKYDSQLAKYAQIEQSEFDAMSKLTKRKKRKRVEDITNIASYMSQHNLFSYESKRSCANGVFMEGDWGDSGDKTCTGNKDVETNDIWSSLEFKDGNSSLEDILWKIEVVHSKVWKLKTRVDKVVKENQGNISSANNFLVPCDALMGSAQNPAFRGENGNRLLFESLSTASMHIKCDTGDPFLPEIAVSNRAELTPLPGITVTDQPLVGRVLENAEGIHLIPKDAVKAEPYDLEVKDPFIRKPCISPEEQKTSCPAPVSETVLPTNVPVRYSEKVMPTSSSVPNTTEEPDSSTRTALPWKTRNQGRRKPGSYLNTLNRKS